LDNAASPKTYVGANNKLQADQVILGASQPSTQDRAGSETRRRFSFMSRDQFGSQRNPNKAMRFNGITPRCFLFQHSHKSKEIQQIANFLDFPESGIPPEVMIFKGLGMCRPVRRPSLLL